VVLKNIQEVVEEGPKAPALPVMCAAQGSTDLAVRGRTQGHVLTVQRASMQRERDTGQAALHAVL
jgi:hypothetical protein